LITRSIYVSQLLPALEAFLKHYQSRDLNLGEDIASAFRLAEILNSLPDRIKLEIPQPAEAAAFRRSSEYREHIRKNFPRYGYVVDFANAVKHEQLSASTRTINGLPQIETRLANCIYRDEAGPYEATQKLLWLRLQSGSLADLRRELVASAKYWTDKLVSYGLIEHVDASRFHYTEHFTREEAAQLPNVRIHGIAGEPLQTKPEVLEYDYQTSSLISRRPGTAYTTDIPFDLVIAESPFIDKK
jgi:hypothetical protein